MDVDLIYLFGIQPIMESLCKYLPLKHLVNLKITCKRFENINLKITLKDILGNQITLYETNKSTIKIYKLLEKYSLNNAFIHASIKEENNVVKILLDNGANINHQYDLREMIEDKGEKHPMYGDTSMIIVCKYGYEKLLKILIKYDIKIDHENFLGKLALNIAIQNSYVDIINILTQNI